MSDPICIFSWNHYYSTSSRLLYDAWHYTGISDWRTPYPRRTVSFFKIMVLLHPQIKNETVGQMDEHVINSTLKPFRSRPICRRGGHWFWVCCCVCVVVVVVCLNFFGIVIYTHKQQHLSIDMKTKIVQHVPTINLSIWHVTCDMRHVTCDIITNTHFWAYTWKQKLFSMSQGSTCPKDQHKHLTCDMWHATCDMWHLT